MFLKIKLYQLPPSLSPSLSPSPCCPIVFTLIHPLSPSPRVTAKKSKEVEETEGEERMEADEEAEESDQQQDFTRLLHFLRPQIFLILPSQSPRKTAKEAEEAEMSQWRLMKR